MSFRTSVVFENDGISTVHTGSTARGETIVQDRANGVGMSSGELLLLAHGSCTAGYLKEYLNSKEIDIGALRVEVSCDFDEAARRYVDFDVLVLCEKKLTDRLRSAMYNTAKACRIHNTLKGGPEISLEIKDGWVAQG